MASGQKDSGRNVLGERFDNLGLDTIEESDLEERKPLCTKILAALRLDYLRGEIESDFQTLLEAGYDTGLGFSLALQDADRAALAQVEQLVSKALAMSMMAATDPVTLTDKTGTIHTIEAQNLSVLMLHYGFGYQQLWGRRAAARAAINAANDAETVTGVTL
jgi:hypothetical protein